MVYAPVILRFVDGPAAEWGLREDIALNPRLVACMIVSALVGLSVASVAILSGWGTLVAFGLYSLSGSITLVLSSFVSALAPDRPLATPAARRSRGKDVLA